MAPTLSTKQVMRTKIVVVEVDGVRSMKDNDGKWFQPKYAVIKFGDKNEFEYAHVYGDFYTYNENYDPDSEMANNTFRTYTTGTMKHKPAPMWVKMAIGEAKATRTVSKR